MNRSEMLAQLKAIIRNNEQTILNFSYGEISFSKMAELLSEEILNHIESLENITKE